jgi:uncharacterized membrane protein
VFINLRKLMYNSTRFLFATMSVCHLLLVNNRKFALLMTSNGSVCIYIYIYMDIILSDKSRHSSPRKFCVKAGSAAIVGILIFCI